MSWFPDERNSTALKRDAKPELGDKELEVVPCKEEVIDTDPEL